MHTKAAPVIAVVPGGQLTCPLARSARRDPRRLPHQGRPHRLSAELPFDVHTSSDIRAIDSGHRQQARGIGLELLTGPLTRIYDPHGMGSMLFAVLAVGAELGYSALAASPAFRPAPRNYGAWGFWITRGVSCPSGNWLARVP